MCNSEVLAKCGRRVAAHWAHIAADCDPWSEPETPWHREWKSLAPPERREVVIGHHRADAVASDGRIVEIQHSPIATADIDAREAHYRRMLWIFDARRAADRVRFNACRRCRGIGSYAGEVDCDNCDGSGTWTGDHASGECYSCDGSGSVWRQRAIECEACGGEGWEAPTPGTLYVVWPRARLDWTSATCPVVLDFGHEILRVIRVYESAPLAFVGRPVTREAIASWMA